jgi:hypothetical protein
MRRRHLLLALTAAAGCDPAVRTDSRAGAPPSSELRSRELETCSRSADCAGELRCIDGACRSGKASVAAEIQAAAGDRALAAGRAREAADAYGTAVSHYEKDKAQAPVELLCNQGHALVADLGDRGSLAARALHRCLLGAPPGSQLRRRALADIAALVDLGLDPQLMARPEPAGEYPLSAPPALAIDDLAVKVAVQSRSRAGSLKRFQRLLDTRPEVKAGLAGCWKLHREATRKNEMAVTISYRYGFEQDAVGDLASTWLRAAESEPPSDPPLAEATRCVRAAVDPIASAEGRKMGEEARWEAAVTFTVAPAG